MKFRAEISDYGKYGCVAKEPRTGLSGAGDTKKEALKDLRSKLRKYARSHYIPPEEGPVRSIRTITL